MFRNIYFRHTGIYYYRDLQMKSSPFVSIISTSTAYQLMDVFCQFQKSFVIRNSDAEQQWRLYHRDHHWMLMGIQDTHQRLFHKKVAWLVSWWESPLVTESLREDALISLSDSLYPEWAQIWSPVESSWKKGGLFHWYLDQWTAIPIGKSFCLMT